MSSVMFVPVGTTIRNQHETVRKLFAGFAERAFVESFAKMLAFPENVAARLPMLEKTTRHTAIRTIIANPEKWRHGFTGSRTLARTMRRS